MQVVVWWDQGLVLCQQRVGCVTLTKGTSSSAPYIYTRAKHAASQQSLDGTVYLS